MVRILYDGHRGTETIALDRDEDALRQLANQMTAPFFSGGAGVAQCFGVAVGVVEKVFQIHAGAEMPADAMKHHTSDVGLAAQTPQGGVQGQRHFDADGVAFGGSVQSDDAHAGAGVLNF